MCRRWRWSFKAFLHDMGPKPHAGWAISRVDHDLGYSPLNCVWSPMELNLHKRGHGQAPVVAERYAEDLTGSELDAHMAERERYIEAIRIYCEGNDIDWEGACLT